MPHDPSIHNRKSIRLPGYDYTQPGVYFITIVAKNHENIFGKIIAGEMRLNEWGETARAEWLKTAVILSEITLDEFIIMPNHIHAIITIMESENGFIRMDITNQTIESRHADVGAQRLPSRNPREAKLLDSAS